MRTAQFVDELWRIAIAIAAGGVHGNGGIDAPFLTGCWWLLTKPHRWRLPCLWCKVKGRISDLVWFAEVALVLVLVLGGGRREVLER